MRMKLERSQIELHEKSNIKEPQEEKKKLVTEQKSYKDEYEF